MKAHVYTTFNRNYILPSGGIIKSHNLFIYIPQRAIFQCYPGNCHPEPEKRSPVSVRYISSKTEDLEKAQRIVDGIDDGIRGAKYRGEIELDADLSDLLSSAKYHAEMSENLLKEASEKFFDLDLSTILRNPISRTAVS